MESKEDLREKILTNELGNRMIDMVAPIYDQSAISLHVFQSIGVILSKETEFVEKDFINQIYPQTATWGLKYWEDEYGITTDESKTIEERRSYLMLVMSKKLPIIPYTIRQIVYGITQCDSKVYENVQPNTIKIVINGYVPGMITALKKELDKLLLAHINYVIQMSEHYEITASTYTGGGVSTMERFIIEEV